ncbi:MAG: Ig-like domain-containing protein [bacterium]
MLSFLFSFSYSTNAAAESVTLSWDPNTESDLSGYKVYYGTESRNYNTVIDIGNGTSYKINNLASGKTYYFALTAYDFSNNESGFSVEVSYSTSQVDTNPPELVAVVAMGETQIDVIFSEPMEQTSTETSSNYSISNSVQVVGAIQDQNPTVVHLITTTHQRGITYVISVSNVKDLAGNSIAAGSALSYSLTIPDQDTVPPELLYVAAIDEANLDVIFSESLDSTSAQNVANYSISNGVAVLQARLDANLSIVHLTTTEHQRDVTYSLTVSNILDLATTPNVIKANSTLSYMLPSLGAVDATPPQLVSVEIHGFTQLDVNFSEPVEKASAEDENNYLINNSIDVLGAVLDANETVVHLITSAHQNGVEYALRVENVRDQAPVPNVIALNSAISYTFTSNDDVPDDPPDAGSQSPSTFMLFQNYPNPFNPDTEIRFFLDENREVSIKIYNLIGQLVKTLVQETMTPGFHTTLWDGTSNDGKPVPSGVYIYALEIKREVHNGDLLVNLALDRRVKKMTLIR